MKIDGIDPVKGTPPKPKVTEPVPGSSFGDLYDSLVSKSGATDSLSKTGALLPNAGVPFLAPPVSLMSPIPYSMAIGTMESLFTDLDMFKSALANSDIPLDRLSNMVSELVDRKDELAGMIGRVPDEELKGVLSDALALLIDLVNQYHAGYAA